MLDQFTIDYLVEKGLLDRLELKQIESKQLLPVNRLKQQTTNNNIITVFKGYIEHLQGQYADNTISGYRFDIIQFFEHYFNKPFKEIGDDQKLPIFTITDIINFFTMLKGQGYASSSMLRFKYSLNSFFNYVKQYCHVAVPEFGGMAINKESVEIIALPDSEIRAIAEYATSLRDKAIILFMYEVGLRRQELIDCKKRAY